MDAVEFFKTVKRLCKNPGCEGCPVCKDGMCMVMRMARLDDTSYESIEETISKVEQWGKEHPIKTRQSEFLALHPDAKIDDCGILDIRPCCIEVYLLRRCDLKNCDKCRCEYWLAEVTDND